MAREVIIDGRPTNLRLLPEYAHAFIDGDLYDICGRLRAYSVSYGVSMSVVQIDPTHFAICETDARGVENLVFRVGPGCEIDALDGRVIDKLNYIRSVPAGERLRQMEAEFGREKAHREEQNREKMWDRLGAPLYANLAKCGFISTPRAESLRPLNKTARRAGRRAAGGYGEPQPGHPVDIASVRLPEQRK